MTKFEQRGKYFQETAYSMEDAIRKFKISCDICCYQGKHLDCDNCIIDNAHKQIVAYFADKANETA